MELFVFLETLVLGVFIGGISAIWLFCKDDADNDCDTAADEPTRWFIRYAYRRTYFGDWRNPTQWFHTFQIITAETPQEAYEKVRNGFISPYSKDGVEIRVFDIHEL